jgi:DNA topoisomerase-1
VQLGEPIGEGKKQEKPKRVSLPRGLSPADVNLENATKLLALPREIGPHPETGDMILAGVGRFGPYLKLGTRYKSLGKDDNVLDIGINRAVALLAEAPGRSRGPAGRKLGDHPADQQPVTIHAGRYGHYVKHGRLNATLPRDAEPEKFTLAEAVALLAERAAKKGSKRKALAEPTPGVAPAPRAKKGAKAKGKSKAKAKGRSKRKAKPANGDAGEMPVVDAGDEDPAD